MNPKSQRSFQGCKRRKNRRFAALCAVTCAAVCLAAAGRTEDELLRLVNRQNPLPETFSVQVSCADEGTGKQLATPAAANYRRMAAAASRDGVELMLCSGYRSVAYQKGLYQKKTAALERAGSSPEQAREQAACVVALPGCSEHNSGLAADIVTPQHQNLDEAFEQTAAFAWLETHAAEYGFILRYPRGKEEWTGIVYEPWHYRYVGPENAPQIKASGLCLEEYLEQ